MYISYTVIAFQILSYRSDAPFLMNYQLALNVLSYLQSSPQGSHTLKSIQVYNSCHFDNARVVLSFLFYQGKHIPRIHFASQTSMQVKQKYQAALLADLIRQQPIAEGLVLCTVCVFFCFASFFYFFGNDSDAC